MVKLTGDCDEILAAKREFMDPVSEVAFRDHGHQSQVIARSDDGVVIFNFWDDQEGRDRANADPSMQEARRKIVAATGAQAEFADWEVIEQRATER